MKRNIFIVGIDEAGRGPLAGPLAVAAVGAEIKNKNLPAVRHGEKIKILTGIKDSKKLNAKQKGKWQKIINKNFEAHYVFISHKTIDKIGIGKSLKLGVKKVLNKFSQKPYLVLLDGSLSAPKKYKQKTIIKGDEKIPFISAASIIAKTARDKKMISLHKKYPRYGFDAHKGYGTKKHFGKIIQRGLCGIHRKTFCKNIVSIAKNG